MKEIFSKKRTKGDPKYEINITCFLSPFLAFSSGNKSVIVVNFLNYFTYLKPPLQLKGAWKILKIEFLSDKILVVGLRNYYSGKGRILLWNYKEHEKGVIGSKMENGRMTKKKFFKKAIFSVLNDLWFDFCCHIETKQIVVFSQQSDRLQLKLYQYNDRVDIKKPELIDKKNFDFDLKLVRFHLVQNKICRGKVLFCEENQIILVSSLYEKSRSLYFFHKIDDIKSKVSWGCSKSIISFKSTKLFLYSKLFKCVLGKYIVFVFKNNNNQLKVVIWKIQKNNVEFWKEFVPFEELSYKSGFKIENYDVISQKELVFWGNITQEKVEKNFCAIFNFIENKISFIRINKKRKIICFFPPFYFVMKRKRVLRRAAVRSCNEIFINEMKVSVKLRMFSKCFHSFVFFFLWLSRQKCEFNKISTDVLIYCIVPFFDEFCVYKLMNSNKKDVKRKKRKKKKFVKPKNFRFSGGRGRVMKF